MRTFSTVGLRIWLRTSRSECLAPARSPRRWPSFGRRAIALLFAGMLQTSPANGQAAGSRGGFEDVSTGGQTAEGTFDAAAVEDLALFFATESVDRLRVPLLARLLSPGERWSKKEEIERIRSDPPRVDGDGVAYPFGDKNPLSFAFDADTRTLSCWERIVKKRGSVGLLSVTGPEMAAALNAMSSRERDRGGADFAYDPIRDALSLRRTYLHPPADRRRFYKDVDRLVATGLKWVEDRYLKKALAIVEGRHPPGSATASAGGFSATLLLRHFSAAPSDSHRWVERYLRTWDRPPGGMTPHLVSDRELLANQTLHAFIHFRGARDAPQGAGRVDATFQLVAPDGSLVFTDLEVPIWRGAVPPSDHLQLGENDLSFALDDEEPTGAYRLEATVCDAATDRCVRLTHPFVLRSREDQPSGPSSPSPRSSATTSPD